MIQAHILTALLYVSLCAAAAAAAAAAATYAVLVNHCNCQPGLVSTKLQASWMLFQYMQT